MDSAAMFKNPSVPASHRNRRVCANCGVPIKGRNSKRYCSPRCKAAAHRQRYDEKHPGKTNARARRLGYERRHGSTPEEFERRVMEQGNRCPIGNHLFGSKRGIGGDNPVQDHSHLAGYPRGILCSRHNLALGGFGDSPELLDDAVAYLRKWRDAEREVQRMLREDQAEFEKAPLITAATVRKMMVAGSPVRDCDRGG